VLCSTYNPTNRKLGLYTPLHVPSHPSESISMELLGGLPLSKRGHDYLPLVVDRFRKMCVLMPCKKQITVEETAHLFFQHVWVHFGLPISIISDQDTRFLGEFWMMPWSSKSFTRFLISSISIADILYMPTFGRWTYR